MARDEAAFDEDLDGRGEFASLAGLVGLSGRSELFGARPRNTGTAYLSASLGQIEGGAVRRSGYFFRVFLPSADAPGWIGERANGGFGRDRVDANRAELGFRVYAWPTGEDSEANRAFFVNERGDVWACKNVNGWSGLADGPGVHAAMRRTSTRVLVEMGETSVSGDRWTVVQ